MDIKITFRKSRRYFIAMAQLERTRRSAESSEMSKAQVSPTFEQLLRVDEAYWSTTTSPRPGMNIGQEEGLSPNHINKKSVLSKVKETAKKLKHSLSGRKNVQEIELSDDNTNPTSDDTIDDDDHEERIDDPEYLGAPMYESEAAPENLKENARQHPRAVPVVSENHRMPNRPKPPEAVTESVSEKISPAAYAAMSDATQKISSKIAGITIPPSEAQETPIETNDELARQPPALIDVPPSLSPGYEAKKIRDKSGNLKPCAACNSPQTWDKGVSVKEYIMNKLGPGDDERALSHAIAEAVSPRKITNNTGVVEKVKEAVASLFWQEEIVSKSTTKRSSSFSAAPRTSEFSTAPPPTKSFSSKLSYVSTASPSPHLTRSANANEVLEEENHGKILQAN